MGDFLSFFFLFLLLFFHELGHFLTAGMLGCSLSKICFYPFGGISKFQMDFNIPIQKEFLILIMGPVFQILTYLILLSFPFTQLHLQLLEQIHLKLLIFNLLPIYPLDGGRLFFLFLSSFFSFYHSLQVCFFFSYFFIYSFFLFFLWTKEFNYLILFFLLLFLLLKEKKKMPIYFQKFLLERFLEKYTFRKGKIVSSEKQFRRNFRHLIYQKGIYSTELFFLKKFFISNR